MRHVTVKVQFYCHFALPVACVAAQEHFWPASNSIQLTWKWTTFPDTFLSSLQVPNENVLRAHH
jgi:hypothetical protein